MKFRQFDLSGLGLHLLAMGLMLCDHLWATVIPGNTWLTWLGRLAFPIFAFLIAEGYVYTRDLKAYRKRLLAGALLSEIPFNLIYSGSWIYPFGQNVLWTFLLALICLERLDKIKAKYSPRPAVLLMALTAAGFFLAGQLTMVDYGGYGVLTVVLFRLTREQGWLGRVGQLLGLAWINLFWMKGMTIPVQLGSLALEFPQQGFAVLALLPIWCYRGRKGADAKWIRWLCYGFYPVHMLILALIQ